MESELPVLERLEAAVSIPAGAVSVEGSLAVSEESAAAVLFAHGTGSGRHSPRNRLVAEVLAEDGFATLLIDLLSEAEERKDAESGELRFDISLLAERLLTAIDWLAREPLTQRLATGLFGASTGAAAALEAAAARPDRIRAVVSRGGRPDLAPEALPRMEAATLLIVGGEDHQVIELNERALRALRSEEATRDRARRHTCSRCRARSSAWRTWPETGSLNTSGARKAPQFPAPRGREDQSQGPTRKERSRMLTITDR